MTSSDPAYLVSNLKYEVAPDEVENKEEGQEEVEHIISREHLENLASFKTGGEYNNGGVVCQPGVDPG